MPKLVSLKICFVGIGSIAKRHIRNLTDIMLDRDVSVEIDAMRRHDSLPVDDYQFNNIYYSVDDMPDDYDIIFITNPTDMHMDMLKMLHDKSKHFFIEKPITSIRNIDSAVNFEYRKDSIYYVACPIRYVGVLQYVKDNVDWGDVISIRSICSSYLPDWRPGTDYRKCYSANKEMGGGVSIDLIHEWDYIVSLMGMPLEVVQLVGKKSGLEIDSEDYAIYCADYPYATVELHLDYYGRASIREMMIITSEDTIVVDILNGNIKYMYSGEVVEIPEERDDYCKRELDHFIDIIEGKCANDNSPMQAYKTLNLTQGIIVD